ncbi:golgin candidate 4 isoform X4 [Dendrobium catenatum]|uniref:golgin candidate 4 isoform X4 n=1 Tax=Dendrobium catenatum TaxID=906689 RepID=UPI00109F428D|nr:golgin candidate 4 isoform X4 [Dendrobium catenatum]
MRNSIASYKESLSRIAHEVLDTAEESSENGPVLARRISQHSSRSAPLQPSSHANGTDHGYIEEIARYRADIQKLQASESEIKALSFNYAALLKEKEEQLRDLQLENGSLRRSLEDRKDDVSLSKDESPRTLSNNSVTPKGDLDRVSLKPRKARTRENSHSGNHALGNSVSKKQNGFDYGSALQNPVVESANSELLYKEREKLLEEVKSLKAAQADHQAEVKLLTEQLDKERANASLLKIKLHEEHERNEASHRELCNLKTDMEKTEKNELEKKLNSFLNNKREKDDDDGSDLLNASKSEQNAVKMTSKVRELEEILKETCKERDKALQELSRLKQHLLDKELEDEDKMDEDCKMIEELKTRIEYQRAQILQLENALLQERTRREELKKLKSDELHQSNETIKELKQKLANFISIIDAKNVELQNLQTALGQYYAESEAKERFGRELAAAREESAKYSELLNAASQSLETSKRENEEINVRLSQTERMLSESKGSLHKLEEENSKLRHALERSMTTLNRMSLDSDNFVDRRIVIKLLVTYFQRNHSKEVLDLMVRMLGFSDEDKQRIGFAQHSAGKGVVRGVLGLPGRLVGGILGGSTAQTSPSSSENQSFADLWVDFLLKETEERERRESSEDSQMYSVGQSDSARTSRAQVPNSASVKQYKPSEHSDAEFSTVPLTTATSALPSHKNSQPIRSQRY